MFLTYQLSEQVHLTKEMLHSAFFFSVLRSSLIGMCEGIRVELIVRGEALGFVKDELLRNHLPRMFSLIKNEGYGD